MRTICSECKAIIRDEDGEGGLDSHGLCERCAEVWELRLDLEMAREEVKALQRHIRVLEGRLADARRIDE